MSRGLSPRQIQIALLVEDALTDEEIAGRLGISIRTVQQHLERIGKKLEAEKHQDRSRRRVIRDWIRANYPSATRGV
jgi:DNA-binding CsgD family transcriptional regulator